MIKSRGLLTNCSLEEEKVEQIRKAVRLASPVTGEEIWKAVQKIAETHGIIAIKKEGILEDDCHGFVQGYTFGFELTPSDPVLWLVIGHGPAVDRNLFMGKPYSILWVCTCKNLCYRPQDEIFEQRLVTGQEAIAEYLRILTDELEKFFLPTS